MKLLIPDSSPDARSSSQDPVDPPSPEFGVKDLLKVLSSPPRNRPSTDFPESLPSISSDQFQAVPVVPASGEVTTDSDDTLDD